VEIGPTRGGRKQSPLRVEKEERRGSWPRKRFSRKKKRGETVLAKGREQIKEATRINGEHRTAFLGGKNKKREEAASSTKEKKGMKEGRREGKPSKESSTFGLCWLGRKKKERVCPRNNKKERSVFSGRSNRKGEKGKEGKTAPLGKKWRLCLIRRRKKKREKKPLLRSGGGKKNIPRAY